MDMQMNPIVHCHYISDDQTKMIVGMVMHEKEVFTVTISLYTKVVNEASLSLSTDLEEAKELELKESFCDTYPSLNMAIGLYEAKILEFRSRMRL